MNRQKLRDFDAQHDKAICLHLAQTYALLIKYRFSKRGRQSRLKALLCNVHTTFLQDRLNEKNLHSEFKPDIFFSI